MDIGTLRPPDDQNNAQPSPFHSRQPQTLDDPQLPFPKGSFRAWQPQTLDHPSQQPPLQRRQFKTPLHTAQQSFQPSQFQTWDIPTQQLPTLPITEHNLPSNRPLSLRKKKLPKWTYVCTAIILLLLIIFVSYGISHLVLSGTQTSSVTHNKTSSVVQKKSGSQATPIAVTHGIPHLGGPISDFEGKYGQPISRSFQKGQLYYGDKSQTINIYAIADEQHNQPVTFLAVVGPQVWNDSQTKAYCTEFLPSNAQEFNSTSNLTDYHSSIGEVELTMSGANMCMLNILGS